MHLTQWNSTFIETWKNAFESPAYWSHVQNVKHYTYESISGENYEYAGLSNTFLQCFYRGTISLGEVHFRVKHKGYIGLSFEINLFRYS